MLDEGRRLATDTLVELMTSLEGILHPSLLKQLLRRIGYGLGVKLSPGKKPLHGTSPSSAFLDSLIRITASWDWKWSVDQTDEDRLALKIHSCPLTEVACGTHHVCHVMSGFLGGLASAQAGCATVLVRRGEGVPPRNCHAVLHIGKAAPRSTSDHVTYPEPQDLIGPAMSRSKSEKVLSGLSSREREILGMVGQALSHQEIAKSLGLSVRTVEGHTARIRDKLGVHGRKEFVRLALSLGLSAP
jgi:DNA-binding CsgD family transcriptional regulator